MNALKTLKTFLLIGVIPVFLALASTARATYQENLQEKAALEAEIAIVRAKLDRAARMQVRGVDEGSLDLLKGGDQITRHYEKRLAQLQHKLAGVQAKIAHRITDAAKEAARQAARDAARRAAQNAAYAAAKSAARDGAREGAKSASKNSSKDSGQAAAKSAAHPPICLPGH